MAKSFIDVKKTKKSTVDQWIKSVDKNNDGKISRD